MGFWDFCNGGRLKIIYTMGRLPMFVGENTNEGCNIIPMGRWECQQRWNYWLSL